MRRSTLVPTSDSRWFGRAPRVSGVAPSAARLALRAGSVEPLCEPFEQRLMLAADLGLLNSAFASGLFGRMQREVNTGVFAAPAPVWGDQLSTNALGQFLRPIDTRLNSFQTDVTQGIEGVRRELARTLGTTLVTPSGGPAVRVVGTTASDEIRFQFQLAGMATVNNGFSLDLALGADPVIAAKTGVANRVSVSLSWRLDITLAVTNTQVQMLTSATDELSVAVQATLSDAFTGQGRVGVFLSTLRAVPMSGSGFSGTYSVDLGDVNGDGRVPLNTLSDLKVTGRLSGSGHVMLSTENELVPHAIMPTALFNLGVHAAADTVYSLSNVATAVFDANMVQTSVFGPEPTINFTQVQIDLGPVFNQFILPILTRVQDALRPAAPLIEFLTTPIPALGELMRPSDPFTPLTLMQFAAGHTPLAQRLERVARTINIIRAVLDFDVTPEQNAPRTMEPLGSFTVKAKLQTHSQQMMDEMGQEPENEPKKAEITSEMPNPDASHLVEMAESPRTHTFTTAFGSTFDLPLLRNTSMVFDLLAGDSSVSVATGGLSFDFTFSLGDYLQGFGIKLFGGLLNIGLDFSLGAGLDLDFGYDLLGAARLSRAVDFSDYERSVQDSAYLLADGFYLDDHNTTMAAGGGLVDGGDNDEPEVTMSASFTVQASIGPDLSFIEANFGVAATIGCEIKFDLNDLPNPTPGSDPLHRTYPTPDAYRYDGRVRIGELEQIAFANPFGFFNTSGEFTFELSAFAFIAVGPPSFRLVLLDEQVTLYSATLFQFNIYSPSDQDILAGRGVNLPVLGAVDANGDLRLYMGATANQRQHTSPDRSMGDSATNESFSVTTLSPPDAQGRQSVEVMFEDRSDARIKHKQRFDGVRSIRAEGGSGNDRISIDQAFAGTVFLDGGAGDDLLSSTGSGRATILGGEDNDTIIGGRADDQLQGDGGDDMIDGRGGNDAISGDDGNDVLDGGDGADVLAGGIGSDTYKWMLGTTADRFVEAGGGQDRDRLLIQGAALVTPYPDASGALVTEADDTINIMPGGANGAVAINTSGGNTTIDNIEELSVAAGGGADRVTLTNLAGTDVVNVVIDTSAPNEPANRPGDTVDYVGSDSDNHITVLGETQIIPVTDQSDPAHPVQTTGTKPSVVVREDLGGGLVSKVVILGSRANADRLNVYGRGGRDQLDVQSAERDGGIVRNRVQDLIGVTLDGGADDDTFNAEYNTTSVIGGGGMDTLTVMDDGTGLAVPTVTADNDSVLVRRAGQPDNNVNYGGIERFRVQTGEPGAVVILQSTIAGAASDTVRIIGGAGPDDIRIETTQAPVTVTLGGGIDTVLAGKNGSLSLIHADLRVQSGDSADRVTYDVSSEAQNQAVGVTPTNVTGLSNAGVLVFDSTIGSVELLLGAGNDDVTALGLTRTVIVRGGGGTDHFLATLTGSNTGLARAYAVENVEFRDQRPIGSAAWLLDEIATGDAQNTGVNDGRLSTGAFADPPSPGGMPVLETHEAVLSRIFLSGANDSVFILTVRHETALDTGAGSDSVQVGAVNAVQTLPSLEGITAVLHLNGGGQAADAVMFDDRADLAAGANEGGLLAATRASGFGMSTSVYVDFNGFGAVTLKMSRLGTAAAPEVLVITGTSAPTTVIDGAGYADVTVRGTSHALTLNLGDENDNVSLESAGAPVAIDGGTASGAGGADVVTIDRRAFATPVSGGSVRDGTAGAGLLTGFTTGDVTFSGMERVDILLGSNSDSATLDYANPGFRVNVQGNAGDDTLTVLHLGGPADFTGGSGFDQALVVVAGNPEQRMDLRTNLSVNAEFLQVDNTQFHGGVAWTGTRTELQAGGSVLLNTQNVGESRVLSGSANDTLSVREDAALPVTGAINGSRVTLIRGAQVLTPGFFQNSGFHVPLTGLDGVVDLAADAGGLFIYAVSQSDRVLSVFRKLALGLEATQQVLLPGTPVGVAIGRSAQAGATRVVVAYSTAAGGGVISFARDATTGLVVEAGRTDLGAGTSPISLRAHPTLDSVYLAVTNAGAESVRHYNVAGVGAPVQTSQVVEGDVAGGIAGLAGIDITPDGTQVFATVPGDGRVLVLGVNGSGALSFQFQLDRNFVRVDSGTTAIDTSADGRFLFHLTSTSLRVYERATFDDGLLIGEVWGTSSGGDAMIRRNNQLFVGTFSSGSSSSLLVYNIDPSTGRLTQSRRFNRDLDGNWPSPTVPQPTSTSNEFQPPHPLSIVNTAGVSQPQEAFAVSGNFVIAAAGSLSGRATINIFQVDDATGQVTFLNAVDRAQNRPPDSVQGNLGYDDFLSIDDVTSGSSGVFYISFLDGFSTRQIGAYRVDVSGKIGYLSAMGDPLGGDRASVPSLFDDEDTSNSIAPRIEIFYHGGQGGDISNTPNTLFAFKTRDGVARTFAFAVQDSTGALQNLNSGATFNINMRETALSTGHGPVQSLYFRGRQSVYIVYQDNLIERRRVRDTYDGGSGNNYGDTDLQFPDTDTSTAISAQIPGASSNVDLALARLVVPPASNSFVFYIVGGGVLRQITSGLGIVNELRDPFKGAYSVAAVGTGSTRELFIQRYRGLTTLSHFGGTAFGYNPFIYDGSTGGQSLRANPAGTFLYRTDSTAGAVNIYSRNGLDTPIVRAPITGAGGAGGLAFVDQRFYVAARDQDAIKVYVQQPGGAANFETGIANGDDSLIRLGGLRSVVVSGDGRFAYAVDPTTNSLVVLNGATLTQVQLLRNGSGGINTLPGVSSLVLAADGQFLYAAAAGKVSAFRRDSSTGMLTAVGSADFTGLAEAIEYAPFPGDPRVMVIVNNAGSRSLVSFGTSTTTGALASPGSTLALGGSPISLSARGSGTPGLAAVVLVGLDSGRIVKITPGATATLPAASIALHANLIAAPVSGAFYAGDAGTNSIYLMDETGAIIQTVRNGQDGVRGLGGLSMLRISPDGRYFFATGANDNSLVVFQRAVDGRLTFIQVVRNNNSGTNGLQAPNSVFGIGSRVYVGSSTAAAPGQGGGVALLNLDLSLIPPPDGFIVSFTPPAPAGAIAQLTVMTAGAADTMSLVSPAQALVTMINTGAGDDFVDLLTLGRATVVDTDGGEDVVQVRSGAAGTTLTVNTGAASDRVDLQRTGPGSTSSINTGDEADEIDANGLGLLSDVILDGGIPTGGATGDALFFGSGSVAAQQTGPANGAGTIRLPMLGQITFTSIEQVTVIGIPDVQIAPATAINEGGTLVLDGRGTNTFGNQARFDWDLNGDGSFGDASGSLLTLPWDVLRGFGINDDGTFSVSLRVTVTVSLATGDRQFASERIAQVVVNNTPPTLTVGGPAPTPAGSPAIVTFSTVDPGNDGIASWRINWGDGSPDEVFASDATQAAHVYQSTGMYTAGVTATDEDGSVSGSTLVRVIAAAPIAGGPYTINEGDSLALNALVGGTPTQILWDLNGDGATDATGVAPILNWAQLSGLGINDDGLYSVRLRVIYADGENATAQPVALNVLNTAPTAVLQPGPSVSEGELAVVMFADQFDPSAPDTAAGFAYSFDFNNDGVIDLANSVDPAAAFTARQAGVQLVRALIRDADGGQTEVFASIVVAEMSPTLTVVGAAVVGEGADYQLDVSAVDPGNDVISRWIVAWGDGDVTLFDGASGRLVHRFADDGAYDIALTAFDDDGVYAVVKHLSVTNVAPMLTISGDPSVAEGAAYTLTLGSIDPGRDSILSWTIDWGDGIVEIAPGGQRSLLHAYSDDSGMGRFRITATAIDEDTNAASPYAAPVDVQVRVTNVAPSVPLSGAPTTEGGNFNLVIGAPVDPGADTVQRFIVDWGDGSVVQQFSAPARNPNGFTPGLPVLHRYADDGVYAVSVRLADEDGEFANSTGFDAIVGNIAPSVVLTGDAVTVEGASYVLSIGGIFDPGQDSVNRVIINWGDGSTQFASGSGQFTHAFLHGAAQRRISVDLVDEDGTYPGVASLDVSVLNAAPVLGLVGPDRVDEGSLFTLQFGSLFDPGGDPVPAVTGYFIDWGDGTFSSANAASPGVNHTYLDGPFDFVVLVDAITASGTFRAAGMKPIHVSNVDPTVAPISGPTQAVPGQTLTFSTTFTDPSPVDTHIVGWSLTRSRGVRGDTDLTGLFGTPAKLTFRYTGQGPIRTDSQSDLRVHITGDPMRSGLVRIVATDANTLGGNTSGNRTFFDGLVSLNGLFTADAAAGGRSVLTPTTYIHILDPVSGRLLQRIELSTSGYDPLVFGDEFGSARLEGYFGQSGAGEMLNENAPLAIGAGLAFSFTPDTADLYTLLVTVTDDDQGTATRALQIRVTDTLIVPGPNGASILNIGGTRRADTITLDSINNGTTIRATLSDAGRRDRVGTFASSTVTGIVIYGGPGDDRISLLSSVIAPATIDGQAGNDSIGGGGGDDLLLGGPGNDTIGGRDGSDIILGGTGTDQVRGDAGWNLVIGGSGSDTLIAGGGFDILITGATLHDQSPDSLRMLLAEWRSGRTPSQRLANLTGTGTGPRLNGNVFLINGTTVFEDGQGDFITGAQSTDLQFRDRGISYAVIAPRVSRVTINDGRSDRTSLQNIRLDFDRDTNIGGLISAGTVVSAVRLIRLVDGVIITLDSTHFAYNSIARQLLLDLTTDGIGGSDRALLIDSAYRLELNTQLVRGVNDLFLADLDTSDDGWYSIDRSTGSPTADLYQIRPSGVWLNDGGSAIGVRKPVEAVQQGLFRYESAPFGGSDPR